MNVLDKFIANDLAAEGITPQVLDIVDLTIEYSPVIPFCGGKLEHAVKVRPWGFCSEVVLPERFEVLHPLVTNPVNRDTLNVRVGFLASKLPHETAVRRRPSGEHHRRALDDHAAKMRAELARRRGDIPS